MELRSNSQATFEVAAEGVGFEPSYRTSTTSDACSAPALQNEQRG